MFVCVCVCVCVHACVCACVFPEASGVIWTSYDWLNKFCSFYMAAVVVIGSGHDLRIEAHCEN